MVVLPQPAAPMKTAWPGDARTAARSMSVRETLAPARLGAHGLVTEARFLGQLQARAHGVQVEAQGHVDAAVLAFVQEGEAGGAPRSSESLR